MSTDAVKNNSLATLNKFLELLETITNYYVIFCYPYKKLTEYNDLSTKK